MLASVNLKKGGPVAWTLLALFIPFALLVWLHRSHRQIGQLSQQRGSGPRRISPWWVSSFTIITTILLVGALLLVSFRGGSRASNDSQAAWGDAIVILDDAVGDPEISRELGNNLAWLLGYVSQNPPVERVEAQPASTGLAWLLPALFGSIAVTGAVYIVHLFQQIEALAALVDIDRDKTLMQVMAALSCLLFYPLVAVVVYRVQEFINQAIDAPLVRA